jgi:DNA-binding LacI/PurR family transcriptional regulator
LRRQGYEQALVDSGLSPDRSLMASVQAFGRDEGAQATTWLLDSGAAPDALFCFNDTLALGALRLLARRGVRVPDDVAVIGIDDIEDGRFSTPTLSTIAPDKGAVARESVRLLQRRIDDPAATTQEVRVDFRLLVRESTTGRA